MRLQNFFLLVIFSLIFAESASAHQATGIVGGFTSGFSHPIFGFDHVVAMVAVGLWGAFLKKPAIWALPIIFPLVMAFGGALGVVGIPLIGVETGIATSAIVLGLMVALTIRPPLWIAATLVGAFAIFHGHAHGAELPNAANPFTYSLGFVLSTGLLHLSGIAFGLIERFSFGRIAIQAAGALIALTGVGFLSGAL